MPKSNKIHGGRPSTVPSSCASVSCWSWMVTLHPSRGVSAVAPSYYSERKSSKFQFPAVIERLKDPDRSNVSILCATQIFRLLWFMTVSYVGPWKTHASTSLSFQNFWVGDVGHIWFLHVPFSGWTNGLVLAVKNSELILSISGLGLTAGLSPRIWCCFEESIAVEERAFADSSGGLTSAAKKPFKDEQKFVGSKMSEDIIGDKWQHVSLLPNLSQEARPFCLPLVDFQQGTGNQWIFAIMHSWKHTEIMCCKISWISWCHLGPGMPSNAYDICRCFVSFVFSVEFCKEPWLKALGFWILYLTPRLCWMYPSSATTIPSSLDPKATLANTLLLDIAATDDDGTTAHVITDGLSEKEQQLIPFLGFIAKSQREAKFPKQILMLLSLVSACRSKWNTAIWALLAVGWSVASEFEVSNVARCQGFKFWALCKVLLQLLWFPCFLPTWNHAQERFGCGHCNCQCQQRVW